MLADKGIMEDDNKIQRRRRLNRWMHGQPISLRTRVIQGLIQLLIFLNVVAVIAESMGSVAECWNQ